MNSIIITVILIIIIIIIIIVQGGLSYDVIGIIDIGKEIMIFIVSETILINDHNYIYNNTLGVTQTHALVRLRPMLYHCNMHSFTSGKSLSNLYQNTVMKYMLISI